MSNLTIVHPADSPNEIIGRKKFNDIIEEMVGKEKTWYQLDGGATISNAQEYRKMRAEGKSVFPAPVLLEEATMFELPSSKGSHKIPLRSFVPPTPSKGVYFHIHGGGWVFGSASGNDALLKRIATKTSLTVVSVEYRLAPEHPFPAPNEDCEEAALYLLSAAGEKHYGGSLKGIGGESAGGHLTMTTIFALRDKYGIDVRKRIGSAVFNYGAFDLGRTPSVRNYKRAVVLTVRDIGYFVDAYLPDKSLLQTPEVSPLFNADFSNLPPAVFVVGTEDALVDDSLFGAQKWALGGNETKLAIFSDAAHGFTLFPADMGAGSNEGNTIGEDFLKAHV